MRSGISLANKCLLLFGVAVVVIIAAALSVPWFHAPQIVRQGQFEMSRQLAGAWLSGEIALSIDDVKAEAPEPLSVRLVRADEIAAAEARDAFIAAALRRARDDERRIEHMARTVIDGQTVYRYARIVRESQRPAAFHTDAPSGRSDDGGGAAGGDSVWAILLIDRTSAVTEGQLLRSRVFIVAAGIVASITAILVFYFILTKLILSPVRELRETTEKVQHGDLSIRSHIATGDEFEQLSEAFNTMLERVSQTQAQLRAINETLDLKLTELAEANVGLYESNRLKSEFLANVSHELRTPLNSIIGFADLLMELAASDPEADPKRKRYLGNILSSGRSLLEMINELLDMAKIEAGRMEVNVEPTSVGDLIEGLVAIMRPQAEAKQIEVETKISSNVPMIETDPGKLQQILYNFLSNAIKFTPSGGKVTLSATRIARQGGAGYERAEPGVRLSVADTGPGIPEDMQEVIFEKFRQIDASHTRGYPGTGLGLAICRELAQMLGASVSFVSVPGRGATFFVDLPLTHQPEELKPLMA